MLCTTLGNVSITRVRRIVYNRKKKPERDVFFAIISKVSNSILFTRRIDGAVQLWKRHFLHYRVHVRKKKKKKLYPVCRIFLGDDFIIASNESSFVDTSALSMFQNYYLLFADICSHFVAFDASTARAAPYLRKVRGVEKMCVKLKSQNFSYIPTTPTRYHTSLFNIYNNM